MSEVKKESKRESKKVLRKRELSHRDSLHYDEVEWYSNRIVDVLIHCSYFVAARSILFYYPHKNEVDLSRGIIHAFSQNKRVVLPRIDEENELLRLYEVRNLEGDLERGKFGILQPRKDCLEISFFEVDLFFIPGVAFDVSGTRLGYGYGYYDQLLGLDQREGKRKRGGNKIGVAYSWQVLEKVPKEENDRRVDFILTEQGLMRCKI